MQGMNEVSRGVAVRIDIEEELRAGERGECLACRISMTHRASEACSKTPANASMKLCSACSHYYAPRFTECPQCSGDQREGR